MPNRLHLILPQPTPVEKHRRYSGSTNVHFPSPGRQRERLSPKFDRLESGFDRRAAELRTQMAGLEPEQVVVLETIGTVDEFVRAVRRIPGLEWLGEWDEDELEPDDDFYVEGSPDRRLGGRVYLLMSNQEGMRQIRSLWKIYREDPENARFRWGLALLCHVTRVDRCAHIDDNMDSR